MRFSLSFIRGKCGDRRPTHHGGLFESDWKSIIISTSNEIALHMNVSLVFLNVMLGSTGGC
jgi:hypothetical protein